MKIFNTAIVLLCSFSLSQAQEVMPIHKKHKNNNEIGIMTDFSLGGSTPSYNMAGIQYKHWSNKMAGYRLAFGYGEYWDKLSDRLLPSGSGDTVLSRQLNYHLPMASIAAGLEIQKKFIHKLFFYAALELKAGYGQGYYDTIYNKRDVYNISESSYDRQSKTGSAYYVAFSPAFGLKLNFKKWVLGTEFSDLIHFVNRDYSHGRLSDLNFNLGDFNQRIYLSYRFR